MKLHFDGNQEYQWDAIKSITDIFVPPGGGGMSRGDFEFHETEAGVLFTENGERFTIILNGLKQNEKPETNVKLTGLPAPQYKMKVIFEDARLGEESFNLFLEPGLERSFSVKKNAKGKYALRMISEVALASAPPSPPSQRVVIYNPQVVTQQTTTTTTGNPDNFNMGVNVDGVGMNINVSGMDMNSQSTTTTTTTTTTTNALPGYNGPVGCPMPMAEGDFRDLKSSIASKAFEESKMTIAKQVLRDHCLLTSQVKDLISLFTFEETKLDFAKYAYDYTYDRGNYFKVNDVFTFESSIEELNNYISTRR